METDMLRFTETPRQRLRLECLRLAVQRAQADETVLALAKEFEGWVLEEPDDQDPTANRVERFPMPLRIAGGK
jgi:hypothetical protein